MARFESTESASSLALSRATYLFKIPHLSLRIDVVPELHQHLLLRRCMRDEAGTVDFHGLSLSRLLVEKSAYGTFSMET